MSNRRKKIKIVVVGDDEVGKTSFIASLITDTALAKVEKIIGPVVLPQDMFNWQYECATVLIDTSSELQDIDLVENEIKAADVVLLMYDITRESTATRLGIYWMPRIQRVSPKIPVVVVGNKSDLLEDERLQDEIEFQRIFKVIKPLIRHFSQVEMGMECSVAQGKSIQDIIHCAQRAFLFPLSPLYNLTEKQITLGFRKALTRIFRLCDRDQDGRWSDKELMQFQQKVFKRDLDQDDIVGIKQMIRKELSDNSCDNGITLEGFIALQKKGIELIKIQTCWTILRYFKYQDDLTLDPQLFNNSVVIDRENGQTLELALKVQEFLKGTYRQYQRIDPMLPISRIPEILFPAERYPWDDLEQLVQVKRVNNTDYIDVDNWLALWHLLTFFDYMEAYKILKYIGYNGSLSDTFISTGRKNSFSEISKLGQRQVFHVLLCLNSKTVSRQSSYHRQQSTEEIRFYPPNTSIMLIPVQQRLKTIILTTCYESDFDTTKVDFVIFQGTKIRPRIQCPSIYIDQKNFNEQSFQSIKSMKEGQVQGTDNIQDLIQDLIENPQTHLNKSLIHELKSQDTFLYKFGAQIVIASLITGGLWITYMFQRRVIRRVN